MSAPINLANYPIEFSAILCKVLEDDKTVKLTFPTVKEAKYQRLRWYGYRKAVAKSQLNLASRAYSLNISIQGSTLILSDVNSTAAAKSLADAYATAEIIDN